METQAAARSYLDFAGLGALRGRATQNQGAALDEAAKQFEAMFIQMMLKSMREASFESGLVQSEAIDSYRDMMDKELAVQLSKRGALGIANMLKQQVQPLPTVAQVDPVSREIDQAPERMPLPAAKALKLRDGGGQ
jgi:Rod binding domain-containing protein